MEEEQQPELMFSDPITTMFELNDRMLARTGRMRLVLKYAYWASLLVSLISVLSLIILALNNLAFSAYYVMLYLSFFISFIAFILSRRELVFVDDYELIASAISRANNWEPNPVIPSGEDHVYRLMNYFALSDNRVGYYFKKRPQYFIRNAKVKGKRNKENAFDGYFNCSSFPWDRTKECLTVFIRIMDVVNEASIISMKNDVMDALSVMDWKWHEKPQAVRAILIQTSSSDFPEDIVRISTENLVTYNKTMSSGEREWNCPIELVAEGANNKYNFGTIYFG